MQLRHFLELLMLRAPAEERIKTDQGDFELFSTACWGPPLRGLSLSVCPSLMLLLQGGAPIHFQGDRCNPCGQIALKWADDSQLLHEVIECH